MHVSFIHIPTIPRSPPAKDVTSLTFFNQHFITKIISLYETLFSLVLLLYCTLTANAQLEQGTWLVGGVAIIAKYKMTIIHQVQFSI